MTLRRADFVIIGSGSAGAALAYRLSENGRHSVLLLEYGGTDIGPFIQMPAALSFPMNMSLYNWGFKSQPEPHLNNRRIIQPRGKVVGGSSSINGMVYVRGHAEDFNHWAGAGADGWSYADVLPYFKRMENWHAGGPFSDPSLPNKGMGDSSWRGTNGPLHVTRGVRKNPLYQAFIEAGAQAGFEVTDDYNGQKQEGFSPFEMTTHRGRRWSVANAYLRPALKGSNLHIMKCFARRIVMENNRACAVEVDYKGKTELVRANREVIICASAFNSPKLLMLSGIGPGDHLRDIGIKPIVNRPGVGQNLQDHLEVYMQMACKQPITLYKHWNIISKALIGARWLFFKSGLGATNHFESTAFLRSAPGIKYPDIQFHFLPIALRYDGTSPAQGHGFQAHTGPMRSKSRGSVTLNGPDPYDTPKLVFNYMSHKDDWLEFRHCIRLTREIFSQNAFKPFLGEGLVPADDVQNDADIDAFIREHAESAYHPCGTCKMGRQDDPMAVVDPQCRVIGVDGLRVVDSSIFPRITNGNINAPSIMVGEKAADIILGKPPLPAENVEPWINPNWQTSDR